MYSPVRMASRVVLVALCALLVAPTWGAQVVPVCEALAGLNHFSIVTDITKKGTRLSALMKQLISLT